MLKYRAHAAAVSAQQTGVWADLWRGRNPAISATTSAHAPADEVMAPQKHHHFRFQHASCRRPRDFAAATARRHFTTTRIKQADISLKKRIHINIGSIGFISGGDNTSFIKYRDNAAGFFGVKTLNNIIGFDQLIEQMKLILTRGDQLTPRGKQRRIGNILIIVKGRSASFVIACTTGGP